MRRVPKLNGVPGNGAGAIDASARVRPTDGAHDHQRDGREGGQVPPQVRPGVRR